MKKVFCYSGSSLLRLFILCILLTIFTLCHSCGHGGDKSSAPEPAMAPGVSSLMFVENTAMASVKAGDIIAVFSTASDTEQTHTYTIRGDLAVAGGPARGRSDGTVASSVPAVHLSPVGRGKYDRYIYMEEAKKSQAAIGDRQTFWSYDLTDVSNPGIAQFTGILKAIGVHCEVYIDELSQLGAEDAAEIARQFDSVAYPIVTAHFGEPPDVDGNPRIAILLPLVFNGGRDDQPNPQGFAWGQFNPDDQHPASSDNPYSNYRDILYLNPGGIRTTEPLFQNKWRSILSHEFQHMVNYRYHQSQEGDGPIDEGKSMLAEILSGYGLPNGDALMWVNVDHYQANPAYVSLVQTRYATEDMLTTYGMGLLWISYLFDRFGPEVLHDIAVNPSPGLAGAEKVTGVSRKNLFAEWVQANILDGIASDPVFNYRTVHPVGDGDGRYFGYLQGFAARQEQVVSSVETERRIQSYGVEYLRVDAPGSVTMTGTGIRVFVISGGR